MAPKASRFAFVSTGAQDDYPESVKHTNHLVGDILAHNNIGLILSGTSGLQYHVARGLLYEDFEGDLKSEELYTFIPQGLLATEGKHHFNDEKRTVVADNPARLKAIYDKADLCIVLGGAKGTKFQGLHFLEHAGKPLIHLLGPNGSNLGEEFQALHMAIMSDNPSRDEDYIQVENLEQIKSAIDKILARLDTGLTQAA